MVKILVVEDDVEMGSLLHRGLVAEGYEVQLVDNGIDALIAFATGDFAAAAIDVMLPKMSGFELCRRIRESGGTVPIILLTARDAIEDRVFGLDSGADDYLTKPFAFAELSARLRAMLRRDAGGAKIVITVGRLSLDVISQRATIDDRSLALSPREFALLRLLAEHHGTTTSRATILDEVWGSTLHIDPNVVEQYISYLRKKVDPIEAGIRITTVRGSGYTLEEIG